ncbi:outer membrane protein assembly factor BamA [Agrobacterium rubi]|nr:outer membrane protein assembly factor BamA [Agrobacterium rubi]NTF24938.1 outer membrane protein assembly factor BamA [Agrobacterium rubi]
MRILGHARAALAAATILTATAVQAETISVVGNERIDPSVVEQTFGEAAASRYTDAELDIGIKQLFASGFFSDVQASRSNGTLEVRVKELPTVGNVVINGNERINDEALLAVTGLVQGTPLSEGAVVNAVTSMNAAYSKTGRQQSRITHETIMRDGNVADVQFTVSEGDKTRVTSITFEGADAFPVGRLHSALITKVSTPLSLLKNDDIYDIDRTERDVEALRAFYHDNGYIDAVVSGPEVVFDEKVNEIYLVFSVDEGRQYRVGQVSINDPQARGVDTGGIAKGDVYSPAKATAVAASGSHLLLRTGSPDAQVTVRPDRKPDGTVDVDFVVEDVNRTYVERIEISGNYKTTDYVIRREIDFAEGDLLNRSVLAQVEKRLRKLDLFSAVSISLAKGSADDRTVVNVAVVEKPSGSFEIGGGYSSKDGPLAVLSFNERNFMGKGRGLRASVGRGIDTGTYDFGLTEPYMFGTRVTGEFSVFRKEWGDQDNSYRPYDETLTGGRFGFSVPITDESLITAYYSISNQQITDVDERYTGIGTIEDPNLVTRGDYVRSVLGGQWSYTTFDDPKSPTEGIKLDVTQEFAGLGGDARYAKTEVAAASAHQVDAVRDIVAHFSVKGGAMAGIGQDLSFTDQFRPGSDLIRGFANGGIGPRDAGTGYSLGGQYYVGASAEARMPMPLMPEAFGLKSAFFADAGTVWNADKGRVRSTGASLIADDATIRASLGTGIIWNSPFGTIRADFAVPVAREDRDRTQIFSLSGGTRF